MTASRDGCCICTCELKFVPSLSLFVVVGFSSQRFTRKSSRNSISNVSRGFGNNFFISIQLTSKMVRYLFLTRISSYFQSSSYSIISTYTMPWSNSIRRKLSFFRGIFVIFTGSSILGTGV